MKRIRFIPAQVKTVPDDRPDACPHCGGGILNKRRTRGQSGQRPLREDRRRPQMPPPELRKDIPPLSARNRPKRTEPADARMGGAHAGARHVPALRRRHALRLRRIPVARKRLARRPGSGGKRPRRLAERAPERASAVGADETCVRVKGKKKDVGIVTDAQTGQVLALDGACQAGFGRLHGLAGGLRGRIRRGGDCHGRPEHVQASGRASGMEHQICMAHPLKWALSRLRKIDGMEWFKDLIWRLLKELPAAGGLELLRLERLVRNAEDQSIRRPRVELSNKWRALLCHRRRWDVPWTNNMTERAMGRSKVRYRTVRGYKSESGLLNGFGLTQWAWSGSDGLELSELVAA